MSTKQIFIDWSIIRIERSILNQILADDILDAYMTKIMIIYHINYNYNDKNYNL